MNEDEKANNFLIFLYILPVQCTSATLHSNACNHFFVSPCSMFFKTSHSLLLTCLQRCTTQKEQKDLLQALCTPEELRRFTERLTIVQMLLSGKSQRETAQKLGASLSTVSRASREIKFGNGIFQKIFSPKKP